MAAADPFKVKLIARLLMAAPEVFCSVDMKQVAAVVPALEVNHMAAEFHCPSCVVAVGSAVRVPNVVVKLVAASVFTRVSNVAGVVAVAPLTEIGEKVAHSLAPGRVSNVSVPLPETPTGTAAWTWCVHRPTPAANTRANRCRVVLVWPMRFQVFIGWCSWLVVVDWEMVSGARTKTHSSQ